MWTRRAWRKENSWVCTKRVRLEEGLYMDGARWEDGKKMGVKAIENQTELATVRDEFVVRVVLRGQ